VCARAVVWPDPRLRRWREWSTRANVRVLIRGVTALCRLVRERTYGQGFARQHGRQCTRPATSRELHEGRGIALLVDPAATLRAVQRPCSESLAGGTGSVCSLARPSGLQASSAQRRARLCAANTLTLVSSRSASLLSFGTRDGAGGSSQMARTGTRAALLGTRGSPAASSWAWRPGRAGGSADPHGRRADPHGRRASALRARPMAARGS